MIGIRGELGDFIGIGLQQQKADLAVFIGAVEALGRSKALMIVHISARNGGNAELRAADRLTGGAVLQLDDQAAFSLIEVGQDLRFAALDENALRRRVEDIAADTPDFLRGDGGAGHQPGDGELAVTVRDVLAVSFTDDCTVARRYFEHDAFQGIRRAFLEDTDRQSLQRVAVGRELLGVHGVDHDGLRPGRLMDRVARDRVNHIDNKSTDHAGDYNFARFIGFI